VIVLEVMREFGNNLFFARGLKAQRPKAQPDQILPIRQGWPPGAD
jgi:hypothetical protein